MNVSQSRFFGSQAKLRQYPRRLPLLVRRDSNGTVLISFFSRSSIKLANEKPEGGAFSENQLIERMLRAAIPVTRWCDVFSNGEAVWLNTRLPPVMGLHGAP